MLHAEFEGRTLYGWNNSETACHYARGGQTHASMTLAISTDYGLTRKITGPIITGTDPHADGKETGNSCNNIVRGQDGYDDAFATRARSSNLGPGQLGYMKTAPDPSRPTVELEECLSKWSGHPDRILIQKEICETQDYQRLRSAGFVYSTEQPNTQPFYRCYSEAEHSHFASNTENCNGMGNREALLGYDLKQ